MSDAHFLFQCVIQAGQVEVSQVLAEVVPDRQTRRAVDDLFQQPKQGFVLELPAQETFEDSVIDRRVEFDDIQLQTILCSCLVPERPFQVPEASMDAFPLDTGISVRGEHSRENGFQNIHHRMVSDPIGIIRETVNQSLLGFVDREGGIGRSLIGPGTQLLVERQKVTIRIPVEHPDTILLAFALPGDKVSRLEVFRGNDPFV